MALAIDASTPAIAVQTNNGTTTVTTVSFTPPSGALLYIRWSWNTLSGGTPSTPTITDNLGTHLTYTLIDHVSRADSPACNGQAAHWWAVVGTSAAMTITVTAVNSGLQAGALHVTVLTGQHATPIGAHGKGASTSAASIAQSYTAQATGGWGFIGVSDWDLLGAETAGTGCTLTNGGSGNAGSEISYAFVRRTSADDSNGASNTLNVTLPGTSTNLHWVYAEIVPAAAASSDAVGHPATSTGVPRPTAGTSTVLRPTTDPPINTPPVVEPVVSAGRGPVVAGSSNLHGALNSAQVEIVDVPRMVVTAGYLTARAGTSWVSAPRTDPAPVQDPPVIEPVTAYRPVTPLPGGVALLAPRAEPTVAPDPPAPRPLVVQPVVLPETGSALVVDRQVEQAPAARPDIITSAGFARAVVPATLLRSTFTAPPVATDVPRAPLVVVGAPRASAAGVLLVRPYALAEHSCSTPRPDTGTTLRPSTGVTAYATATTTRPDTGITPRPDTGVTEDPC